MTEQRRDPPTSNLVRPYIPTAGPPAAPPPDGSNGPRNHAGHRDRSEPRPPHPPPHAPTPRPPPPRPVPEPRVGGSGLHADGVNTLRPYLLTSGRVRPIDESLEI